MLKKILIGVVAVIAVIVVAGFVLPSDVKVSRSVTIKAPPAQVWTYVSTFKNFNKWSPWAALDPKTVYTYSGPDGAVGMKMVWTSDHPNVGNGSQEVVEVRQGEFVKLKLEFDGQQNPAYATYTLEKDGEGTRFTWGFEADMGKPIGSFMVPMMDGWIGKDYETGCAKLKELAEAGPAAAASAEAEAAPKADAEPAAK